MDCMGVWSSGTSYVSFEDVLVPVENVLGQENKGFQVRLNLSLRSRCACEAELEFLAAHHGQLQPYALSRLPERASIDLSFFAAERIGIAIQANRFARVCLEESISASSFFLDVPR